MRISVGVDIVKTDRVAALLEQGRLERMLLPGEMLRKTPEHIAGLIALKEAAIKALGLTADDWLEVVITRSGSKPNIQLLNPDESIVSMDCSVSHDGEYAVANVTILYGNE